MFNVVNCYIYYLMEKEEMNIQFLCCRFVSFKKRERDLSCCSFFFIVSFCSSLFIFDGHTYITLKVWDILYNKSWFFCMSELGVLFCSLMMGHVSHPLARKNRPIKILQVHLMSLFVGFRFLDVYILFCCRDLINSLCIYVWSERDWKTMDPRLPVRCIL